jgi:hypothetical protein
VRKVEEYERHAKECRRMATTMSKPEHKRALEDMAKAWETLANERKTQLKKGENN